jgi:hypothetical protein
MQAVTILCISHSADQKGQLETDILLAGTVWPNDDAND